MRVDNIKFHPVRLGLTRRRKDSYLLSRFGKTLGKVNYIDGQWWAFREGRPNWDRGDNYGASFKAAVLRLARISNYIPRDGPQDWGNVRMIRVQASGIWYTIIFHKGNKHIYEDYSIPKEDFNDEQQANLRCAIAEAEKWARKNL